MTTTDNQQITLPAPIARLYALHLLKQELKRRQVLVRGLRKKAHETSGLAKHYIHLEMWNIGSAPSLWVPREFSHSTRAWHLAYAFLRGVPYHKAEPTCRLTDRRGRKIFESVVHVLRDVLQAMSDEDYQDLILDDRNVRLWQSRRTVGAEAFAGSLKTWFEEGDEKSEEESQQPLAA